MFDEITELCYQKKDVILFNSHSKSASVVLSNFYPCRLSYGGIVYNSVEQLFYVMRLTGHPKHQENLLLFEARDVKKYGKKYLQWLKVNDGPERLIPMLRFCIRLKYDQCEEFQQFLLANPRKKLVEYAPWGDDTWGMIDEDEDCVWNWYKGNVRGQNVCGRIIQQVRREGQMGEVVVALPEWVDLPQGKKPTVDASIVK